MISYEYSLTGFNQFSIEIAIASRSIYIHIHICRKERIKKLSNATIDMPY